MNYFDLRPTIKIAIIMLIIGAMVGFWACKKLTKPEVRIETQEKEVVKTDIRTVTRTIERPDGSKETVVETTDKTKTTASKQAVVQISKPNWMVGVAVESDYKLVPTYEVEVNRRILGPVFLGLSMNTKVQAGLRLTMEF